MTCCWQTTFPSGWSSKAFSDGSPFVALLNYQSYGLKRMTLRRAVVWNWMREGHSFWIFEKKTHCRRSIWLGVWITRVFLSNRLSGVHMPLTLVMLAQQWWAPAETSPQFNLLNFVTSDFKAILGFKLSAKAEIRNVFLTRLAVICKEAWQCLSYKNDLTAAVFAHIHFKVRIASVWIMEIKIKKKSLNWNVLIGLKEGSWWQK